MDVNGLRSWQAADAAAFRIGTAAAKSLRWLDDKRVLRLDREQAAPSLAEDKAFARKMVTQPSPVSDPGGSFAWWDGAAGAIRASGFMGGAITIPVPPDTPPGVPTPTDLAFGDDDVLYVARNGNVLMVDRRNRWEPARVSLAGFAVHRLAPAPGGGAWALDRTTGALALLTGQPLRTAGITPPDAIFAPTNPNPHPPRLRRLRATKLPAAIEAVAIAASPGGRVALIGWRTGADAMLYTLEGRALTARFALEGLRFPYGLAWAGEDKVAVLASDGPQAARQAFVYEVDAVPPGDAATALPSGEVFRLFDPWPGTFCNAPRRRPEYLTTHGDPAVPRALRRLLPLSRPTYARTGSVTVGPFDAGKAGAVWHRLFAELSLSAGGGVRIWAHADETGAEPVAPGAAGAPVWAPHIIGEAVLDEAPQAARASWCAEPSELPFNPGLSPCPQVPNRSGLFTALMQRPDARVRRIAGRWLWLHIELMGDGRSSPELAGIRAYAERVSWRDRYLPAFYREPLGGADGAATGAATPHDFLDRFLGLFEGSLTQLEGKVAGSWLLTDPAASPDTALAWLGSWLGVDADAGDAAGRMRERLRAAPYTAPLHGTLGGLLAALECETGGEVVLGGKLDPEGTVPRPGQLALVSLDDVVARALVLGVNDPRGGQPLAVMVGGAVSRGEIVVVEGWRLRRTFATVLGADMEDAADPLLLGLTASGNSFVGDTLILGEEARGELFALFSAELPQSAADTAAVDAFYERLAHRVLILVRESDRTADRARLADVAAREAPAHVETSLWTARMPLIVDVASLVGIDTFLLAQAPPRPVRVGRSTLGTGDLVMGSGRLDARADGPVPSPPTAVIDGPASVFAGTGFVLSAARSQPAPGRQIIRNIWTWV